MNSNRHFDEHIKEQFGNYEPDVHPRIWENIVAQRERKRPAGFWVSMFSGRNRLLVLGLIIALSSGGAWVYFNKDITGNNPETAVKNNNANRVNDTGITANSSETDEQQLSTVEQNTHPLTSSAANNTSNTNQSLVSPGAVKAMISSPSTGYDEDEKSTTGLPAKNKKYITGLGNVLVNTTAPDTDEDEFEGQGTLLGRLTYNAEKYTIKRKAGKPETISFDPVVFLPDCPTFEKDAAGNKKYFEFYAGPDYAIRSMHDTGNSAYLQKRKESTAFKSAFSAGARFTRVFNNSMSIRGGVNYSQINEKFTYNQGNVVVVTYIINNNGDTIGSYTTTGSRHKTTINRYRSIDIPIVVGYEVGNGKLHANINAGAVVNIYSWQKGDVLDTAGNPVSITSGKGSSPYQFKSNAGIGFIGAVSVYYKLNDRLHIMAEPYFRYNFSPMNKEGITLKQKYQTAGLRLGIRLDLK
jgi:hypothetical protein